MGTYADGAVIITIDADGKLAIQELKKTKEQVDKVGESSEDSKEKVGGLGEETKNSALKMAAFSATVAAGAKKLLDIGAAAVAASSQFESAFAKTQTIMDTNVLSVSDMREEVLSLSKDSAMAATDVSEAVYQAISGSVATQDAAAFVEQANKLAVAGFTGLSNATDVLTTTLNSYKLGAEQVGGISNVLIQTQNLGKTSVDELASSMGRAISTGSAYGVNLQNISTSYVELTRSGIATAEATTYLSGMLNELGDAGSTVGGILQEKTGQSFGQLMAQGWSLGDVLQVLSDSVDGNAEALMGLWSSQEAGKAANAIMTQGIEDFNAVIAQMNQEMSGATDTTEKAYATMTGTSEFIDKKFRNSVNNLTIAFGDGLTPVLNDTKQWLTGIVDGLAEFVQQNPWVSAAFAGLTVGIGAMAIGLAAYTLKTKLATSATLQLTAAMATNPIMLAVGAVAALTAVLATYASATKDARDESNELTASSQKQKDALDELEKEYKHVCEENGETSAAAQLLKQKLDDETEAFKKNKQTVGESRQAFEEWKTSREESAKSFEEASASLDAEYDGTVALIERLQELTSAEHQSAEAKQEILSIVDILNSRLPELGLVYDTLTGILNMSPDDLEKAALDEYHNRKNAATREELVDLVGKREEDEKTLEEKRREKEAAEKAFEDKRLEAESRTFLSFDPETLEISNPRENAVGYLKTNTVIKYEEELEDLKTKKEKATAEFEEASDIVAEESERINELTGSLANNVDATDRFSSAAAAAAEEWSAASEALKTAYEEAYTSARESIDKQITLFENMGDTMKSINSITAVSAQEATAGFIGSLDTQIAYLDTYATNMQLAAERGIDQGILQQLSDGSEESAEILANLVNATDEQIQEMNEKWGKVSEGKDTFAESMTEYTGVIEDEKTVMVELAAQAGIDMSDAITRELLNGIPNYEAAWRRYQDVFAPVAAPTETTMRAYASGTSYAAAGYAIVGENGPELVYFQGGERVLTAEETQAALRTVYPTAPQMTHLGTGSPAIARSGGIQICATFAVPLEIDGREFARATAEYNGEEMEFEVM